MPAFHLTIRLQGLENRAETVKSISSKAENNRLRIIFRHNSPKNSCNHIPDGLVLPPAQSLQSVARAQIQLIS